MRRGICALRCVTVEQDDDEELHADERRAGHWTEDAAMLMSPGTQQHAQNRIEVPKRPVPVSAEIQMERCARAGSGAPGRRPRDARLSGETLHNPMAMPTATVRIIAFFVRFTLTCGTDDV